jgi:hypothetical protein
MVYRFQDILLLLRQRRRRCSSGPIPSQNTSQSLLPRALFLRQFFSAFKFNIFDVSIFPWRPALFNGMDGVYCWETRDLRQYGGVIISKSSVISRI